MKLDPSELVHAFLRDTQDTIAVLTEDGTFLSFVPGSAYIGKDPSDVIGRKVSELVPAPAAARILAGLGRATLDGPAVVIDHQRPSPLGPRDMCGRVVRLRDGTLMAHIRDVTDTLRAEHAAKESNERYLLLARATTDAVFDWDAVTDRVLWNEHLESRFGYPSTSATTFQWWIDHVHPDDQAATSAGARATMDDPTQEIWTGEFRFRRADGTWRDVFERAIMCRDASGSVVRVIGSMLDITERKRMAARLERGERTIAAATLAASVGHELRGPLNYLLGNLALAVDELRGPKDLARALRLLQDAALGGDRLTAIVEHLKALTREDGKQDVVDMNDVVSASIKMLEPRLRADVFVDFSSAGPAFVEGDAHRLGQMVTNVLNNALEAIRDSKNPEGEVRVALSKRGASVQLDIEDNGRGVTAEEAAQLFDPLFTTRQKQGGTGLGLAVAHAVVTFHNGQIEVAPRTPRGAVFSIALPACGAPVRAADRSPHDDAVAPSQARARVLVVDDDELTLKLVESILDVHEVTKAASGEEALDALAKKEFDIVLSDVVMPALDGLALRDAVLRLGRPIKFAFLSAGGDGVDVQRATPCLTKPFSPHALRRFVRDL